jgi:hypothetical protein
VYDEQVDVPSDVMVVGACPAETTLGASVPSTVTGVVNVLGPGAEVYDVSIAASPRPAIAVIGAGASVLVRGVTITEPTFAGLLAFDGGVIHAEEVLIRDAGLGTTAAYGAFAAIGAELELRRTSIIRSDIVAINVTDDSVAVIEDTRVEGTPSDGLPVGAAMSVESRAQAFVRRSALLSSVAIAVLAKDATLEAEDFLLAETRENTTGQGSAGVLLAGDTSAKLSRAHLVQNAARGIVLNDGTQATLSDIVVRDTHETSADGWAVGILGRVGSDLTARRVLIERSRVVGMLLDGDDTKAVVNDLTVRHVEPPPGGFLGWGVSVQNGADATLERTRLEALTEVGAGVFGARLRASDLVVDHVRSAPTSAGFLGGVLMLDGADVVGTRVRVHDVEGVAIGANGSAVELATVSVVGTARAPCADAGCAEYISGVGVVSFATARVTLSGFAIDRSALCGVHIATGGDLRLTNGRVSGSPIGACVQVDGYDYDKLTPDVSYADNGANLEATQLPLPARTTPLDASFDDAPL